MDRRRPSTRAAAAAMTAATSGLTGGRGRGAEGKLDVRGDRGGGVHPWGAGAEAEGSREGHGEQDPGHWFTPRLSTPKASRMLRVIGAFPGGPSPLPAGRHATRAIFADWVARRAASRASA